MLNDIANSSIKGFAFNVFDKVRIIADRRIQNGIVKKFWDWFATRHIKSIILQSSDIELEKDLKDIYELLEPHFKTVDMSLQLHKSKELNNPEMTKKLMQMPDFAKLAELMNDVM